MVQLCMGMIHSQGMLLCGNVVSQYQIQFKIISASSGNGSDGVVGLPLRLCIDKGILIRIASGKQNLICQFYQPFLIRSADTNYRHGPFYDSCFHIGKTGKLNFLFHLRFCHGKGIVPALEMVMA